MKAIQLLIFLVISFGFFAQEPTFSKNIVSKKKNANTDLKSIIDKLSVESLDSYFKKNRKLIDDPVSTVDFVHENGLVGKEPLPVIHYVFQQYIKGNDNYKKMIEWYLKNDTEINSDFRGKSIIYYLLDDIATKKANETNKQVESIKMIIDSKKFNVNDSYSTFLPPLPYLLRTHFDFLKKKYDPNYIDSELIKFLIGYGANLETYDQSGNNLMALALTKNDNDLIQFLIAKNINLLKTDNTGKDPLYYAIENSNEQVVQRIIENLNNKISPSYLHLINATNLDLYKNEKIKNILLDACYPNIKDISDIIIFSKTFYKEKKKMLNPIPIELNPITIPSFVNIFDNENLNKSEVTLIKDLKIKYINSSNGFSELISRLKVYPFFKINNYEESDYKMIEGNKLTLLKNEIDNIPSEYSSIKTKLTNEYSALLGRCNVIKENKKFEENFYKNVKIVDNFFWIAKGEGANFWEAISIDKHNKFNKIKLCLISQIQNNADIPHKVQLKVNYNYNKESNTLFGLANSGDSGSVTTYSYIEIPPRTTLPLVTVYDFKETFFNYGILVQSSVTIDQEKPYSAYYFPYNGVISNEYIAKQAKIQNELRTFGKLSTKKGYDDIIQNQCDNCIVDEKKSKGPHWEEQGFIWKELVERNGVIAMKNGKKYEFKTKIRNGKLYFQFLNITFYGLDKEYTDFDLLYNDLIKSCKQEYCN